MLARSLIYFEALLRFDLEFNRIQVFNARLISHVGSICMTAVHFLFAATISVWLYTMVIYPLTMAVIGFLCHNPVTKGEVRWPLVSLIVPCHNEEAVIAAKLANVAKIDYPKDRLEIFVVSDGSEDRTVEITKESAPETVHILDFRERRGKTSIVNDAVAKCSGSLLCLCDANVMFHPDALRLLVRRLINSPAVGAVTGDVRLASENSDFGAGESLYYRFERALQVGESALGSTMGVDGGMYVLRRELYYPPMASTILDDFVISMRVIMAGKRVIYEPAAVADENATPSSGIEFRRRIRVTAGAVQTLRWGIWPSPFRRPVEFWQWCSHKFLRWLSPFWLIAIFVLSGVHALSYAWAAWFLALQMLLYSLAILALLMPSLRRFKLFGVCYYFALSHVAMLIGLYKGIRGTQPVTWRRTQRSASIDTR